MDAWVEGNHAELDPCVVWFGLGLGLGVGRRVGGVLCRCMDGWVGGVSTWGNFCSVCCFRFRGGLGEGGGKGFRCCVRKVG